MIVERFKFPSLKQQEFQSAQEFVMKVRKQVMRSAFAETLQETLRDQLVIGA